MEGGWEGFGRVRGVGRGLEGLGGLGGVGRGLEGKERTRRKVERGKESGRNRDEVENEK